MYEALGEKSLGKRATAMYIVGARISFRTPTDLNLRNNSR
jgi:hypothetical protein